MKKFVLIAICLFGFLSCTVQTEEKTDLSKTETSLELRGDLAPITVKTDVDTYLFVDFPSDEHTPVDLANPQTYEDQAMSRPVAVAYWECAPGVYTNGASTYSINHVGCETPNCYMHLVGAVNAIKKKGIIIFEKPFNFGRFFYF